jgi:uncharacterized protein YkwD
MSMFGHAQRGALAVLCMAPLAAVAGPNARAADAACGDADATPASDNLEQVRSSVSCLVNAARSDRGEPPVRTSGQLGAAAQEMSDLMVRQSFFGHDTPDGRTLADRVAPTGYLPPPDRWILGENLGWGTGPMGTARAIVQGWLNSSEHRATMLDPEYEDLGIGVTLGPPGGGRNGGATFTADFGVKDSRPSVTVPAHLTANLGDAGSQDISYSAACSRPCTLIARLFLARGAATAAEAHVGATRRRLLASGRLRLSVPGSGTLTVRLPPKARRRLRQIVRPRLALVTVAAGTPVARTTPVTLRQEARRSLPRKRTRLL